MINIFYFILLFFMLTVSLSCGKYKPDDQRPFKCEWIYSVKLCSCPEGDPFVDTIRPDDLRHGIWNAKLQITTRQDENSVLMYVNDNLAAANQYDNRETGSSADYIGNYDDGLGIRLFSEMDSFVYSMPNDIAGYSRVIETPDFPFKSDIYQNQMDTFTVNFFRFIE